MSTSPPGDAPSEPSAATAAATTGPAHELLACVNCRSRKLKCDRQRPVCTRCLKAGGDCVYPESRRKPAFKRRNVRELEERLAQVEGLLRTVGKQRAGRSVRSEGAPTESSSPGTLGGETVRHGRPRGSPLEGAMPWIQLSPTETPAGGDNAASSELMGLGRFESLPPFEMIEDLHNIFFATQHLFLPIIHPDNYFRSFHSPPHMRPPMCLQYAIWTAASNGHPKYGCYHDALYRRARQYLEDGELKGYGEHFITIGHAQAWAIVATDETRCLLFTRAAMSSARSVRLAGMMGLHRLDSTLTEEELPMAPMITAPQSWAELEERRRLFWGGFCIDSYASISTGWPTLIDVDQITTQLPASENAFTSGTEEKASTLQDALKGASYSTFAGNVVVCHIFTRLVKHSQRPMPDDHPEDPDFGPFWKRHRELDNILSNAFMFLPERFRLSRNGGDPIAVQANLNLHGAVICLQVAAREKADKFKLAGIRQASRTRALTAAQEIVDIMRATKDMSAAHRGPLAALSLYFAASVYTAQAKDSPEELDKANLEFLVQCMNAIGHQHVITHAYLNQLLRDVERVGISISAGTTPNFEYPNKYCGHGIPLIARGSASRHAKIQPPLPGRLPLGAPQGTVVPQCPVPFVPCATFIGPHPGGDDIAGPASKRARTSIRQGSGPRVSMANPSAWSIGGGVQTFVDPAPDLFEYTGTGWSYATKYMTPNITTTTLPHRTGSPAINSGAAAPSNTVPDFTGFIMPGGSMIPDFSQIPGAGPSTTGLDPFGLDSSSINTNTTTTTTTTSNSNNLNPEELVGDMGMFESLREWGMEDPQSLYSMLLDMSGPEAFGATSQEDESMDPWSQLNSAGGSSSAGGGGGGGRGGGGAWDTGGGAAGCG